jgi:hypothetical protein
MTFEKPMNVISFFKNKSNAIQEYYKNLKKMDPGCEYNKEIDKIECNFTIPYFPKNLTDYIIYMLCKYNQKCNHNQKIFAYIFQNQHCPLIDIKNREKLEPIPIITQTPIEEYIENTIQTMALDMQNELPEIINGMQLGKITYNGTFHKFEECQITELIIQKIAKNFE